MPAVRMAELEGFAAALRPAAEAIGRLDLDPVAGLAVDRGELFVEVSPF
jgi:hypothetical protein